MKDQHSRGILASTWNKLGRCSYCMRKTFQFAVAAWLVSVVLNGTLASRLSMLADLIAILFTALWFIHLSVFAMRRVKDRNQFRELSDVPMASRRLIILQFARSLSAAAAVTALPLVIRVPVVRRALAQPPCEKQDQCDCSKQFIIFGGCINGCDSCGPGTHNACNETLFSCACDCVP